MSRSAMSVDGPSSYEPIAIVGMGCRFPGSVDSPAGLWRLLVEGRDTAGLVPKDRWDAGRLMAFQHPDDAPRIGWGCFLDGDIWAWDPEALSIAKLEAAVVDPQHRLMLEVVREAIEHAGVPMDRVRGTRTGVYLGYFAGDNQWRSARPVEDHPDPLFMYGNFNAAVAGRVSFGLDLRGPNMVVETFCSSSLVATHLACVALQSGDCDAALAGASQLIPAPMTQVLESSLLSRRGRCHAFDERADGYVRGEGAGAVLLKRLDDALAAGDRVLAVIRGSAVTNDGQTQRATAPSTVAQQACFRSAVERAGVDPGDVGFVEAHGTGTEVGDPVEYASINAVYGRGRDRCAIGSLKTNIGHTEATAGTAGLIKAVLCLRHGMIPPNLHFRRWHPAIPVDQDSRLFVPTEKQPWPVHNNAPRLAAVCSYGIGGANAHVIVEQAPAVVAPGNGRSRLRARGAAEPARVFTLSAASDPALQPAAARLAQWLDADGAGVELGDLAHTLTLRRWHAPERLGVVASSRGQLVARLRAFAAGLHGDEQDSDGVVAGQTVLPPNHAGPVLVFPGLGGQWPGMGQDLLDTEPAFTAAIDELDAPTKQACGRSLRTLISQPELWDEAGNIYHTMVGLQIAVAAMWRSWGITPAAVIGQSLGEVPAAVVAGALSPAEAVAVTRARAIILERAAGGGMASVLLPADQVERDIATVGADKVSVGVYVSPQATVVSGDRAQITHLMRTWQQRGVTARWVAVNVASHSPDMDPVLEQYRQLLHEVNLPGGLPSIPFYSTVAQDPHDGARVLDAAYWVRNTRQPVLFSSACAAALADGHRLFIECSAHPLAVRAIADIAREAHTHDVVAVSSLRRDAHDHDTFLTNLATVHTAGHPIDWTSHYGDGDLVEAPTTTWNRVHHRVDPPYTLVAPKLVGAAQHPLLGGYVHDPDHPKRHLWQTPISPDRLPWLSDHKVAGVPIMAGAGICEMMLAAATTIFDTGRVQLRDLQLERPLVLEPEPLVSVVATCYGDGARVEVLSRATGPDAHQEQVRHGHATVAPLREAPGEPAVRQRAPGADWTDVAPSDLYAYFRERHGIVHGPAFTGLERIQIPPTGETAVATLRLTDEARVSSWMMRLHPALLDELAQAGAAVWRDRHVLAPGPVVFAGIDRLTVFGPAAHARRAHIQLDAADHTSTSVSGALSLADGQVVAQIEGLRIVNTTPPEQRFTARLAHLAWIPAEVPQPSTTAAITDQGCWVVVAETTNPWANALAEALRVRGADARLQQAELHADPTPHIEDLIHHGRCAGVVLALGDNDDNNPCELAQARVGRACRIAGLLATQTHPARLWVAVRTNGASLTAAGLRGVLRTATYECPQLAPSWVEADADTALDEVATEILRPGPAVEVAWRGGHRYTARLRIAAPDTPAPAPPGQVTRPDGTYLITGGLGGIGRVTASWLAGHGARHLVLVSRSVPSAQAQQTLAALREQGTQVTVLQGDIGTPDVAQAAVLAAEQDGAVLRGVFHCAGVVQDATLTTLAAGDLHQLAQVWRGKAHGAWALHEVTLDRDLDWWVLYSSMAALVGSPGQTAHASANAWLDELAAWRAAQGLPAASIQWGGWSEVGEGQHMAERGYAMISPNDGMDALDRILATGYTTIAYAPPDLARWTKPYPGAAEAALFTDALGASNAHDDNGRLLADLRAADTHTQRQGILHEHIIAVVRDILGTTSRVTPVTSMVALGLDSLGAVQLQQRLQHSLKITFETGVVWLKPTAAGITDWILHKMGYHPDTATSTPATTPHEIAAGS